MFCEQSVMLSLREPTGSEIIQSFDNIPRILRESLQHFAEAFERLNLLGLEDADFDITIFRNEACPMHGLLLEVDGDIPQALGAAREELEYRLARIECPDVDNGSLPLTINFSPIRDRSGEWQPDIDDGSQPVLNYRLQRMLLPLMRTVSPEHRRRTDQPEVIYSTADLSVFSF